MADKPLPAAGATDEYFEQSTRIIMATNAKSKPTVTCQKAKYDGQYTNHRRHRLENR